MQRRAALRLRIGDMNFAGQDGQELSARHLRAARAQYIRANGEHSLLRKRSLHVGAGCNDQVETLSLPSRDGLADLTRVEQRDAVNPDVLDLKAGWPGS